MSEAVTCPKCSQPGVVDVCRRCGLARAAHEQYAARLAAEDENVPAALRDKWKQTLADWDNVSLHATAYQLAVTTKQQHWLARQYREYAKHNQHDQMAASQLEKFRIASEAELKVMRDVSRESSGQGKGKRFQLVLAAIILIAVVGGAGAIYVKYLATGQQTGGQANKRSSSSTR